jgi:hypothetical protein
MFAITVADKTLFLPEFFDKLYAQDYPKNNIFIHIAVQNITKVEYVRNLIKPWTKEYR